MVDIWALGVILYEMFHARMPYESSEDSIRLHKIEFDPNLDTRIQDLITRCLKIDPKQRPKIKAIL